MEAGVMLGNDENKASEGLFRQRRNVLVISLLIIFLERSGATIESISVAGTALKFSNPTAIYQGLWLLFFYFNIRYFQHYLDEGRAKFNAVWDSKFAKNATEIAMNYVHSEVAKSGIKGTMGEVPQQALSQIQWFKWKVDSGYIYWVNKTGSREYFNRHIEISLAILWRPAVKTCYQVILLGKTFTDYAVPFIVSALALGLCGFSGWNGSLYKLIFS